MKLPVIYAIKCDEKYLYIGHSKNFIKRKREHICCIKNYQKNRLFYKKLFEIGVYNLEWEILEEVFSFDKDILKECERFFIDFLNPIFNKEMPGRTQKEWTKDNKEKSKGYKKEWREKNKEYQKLYNEKNKNKYTCEKCNFNSSRLSDFNKHCKTKKHLKKNS